MKKQFFFLGAILGFSITLIGGYASGREKCGKDVPDFLKNFCPQLDHALDQVWIEKPTLPVSPLTPLKSVSSQELNKKGLKTDEDGYQGVAWVGPPVRDSLTQKALDAKKTNGIMPLPGDIWVWVAPAKQVRDFFLKTSKGSILNQDISQEVKLRLRILQYLGLRLNDFNQKTHFVTIIAQKSDIRRPCLNPEKIDDVVCQPFNTQEARDNFMKDKDNQGLISEHYPWTGLGYTYDWGNPKKPTGASEYVIKKGATVYIESVEKTCDFLTPKCESP